MLCFALLRVSQSGLLISHSGITFDKSATPNVPSCAQPNACQHSVEIYTIQAPTHPSHTVCNDSTASISGSQPYHTKTCTANHGRLVGRGMYRCSPNRQHMSHVFTLYHFCHRSANSRWPLWWEYILIISKLAQIALL